MFGGRFANPQLLFQVRMLNLTDLPAKLDIMKKFILAFIFTTVFVFNEEVSAHVNFTNIWKLPREGSPTFYRYFRDRISWVEADAVCQFHHSELIITDNADQYDTSKAFISNEMLTEPVWIGLRRSTIEGPFYWTNEYPILMDAPWQSPPPETEKSVCAAIDPKDDYKWRPLNCNGPETISFICEVPIPFWAKDCMLKGVENLKTSFLPDENAIQLTNPCDGKTRRVICRGSTSGDELLREVSCEQLDKSGKPIVETESSAKATPTTTPTPSPSPTTTFDIFTTTSSSVGTAFDFSDMTSTTTTMTAFPDNPVSQALIGFKKTHTPIPRRREMNEESSETTTPVHVTHKLETTTTTTTTGTTTTAAEEQIIEDGQKVNEQEPKEIRQDQDAVTEETKIKEVKEVKEAQKAKDVEDVKEVKMDQPAVAEEVDEATLEATEGPTALSLTSEGGELHETYGRRESEVQTKVAVQNEDKLDKKRVESVKLRLVVYVGPDKVCTPESVVKVEYNENTNEEQREIFFDIRDAFNVKVPEPEPVLSGGFRLDAGKAYDKDLSVKFELAILHDVPETMKSLQNCGQQQDVVETEKTTKKEVSGAFNKPGPTVTTVAVEATNSTQVSKINEPKLAAMTSYYEEGQEGIYHPKDRKIINEDHRRSFYPYFLARILG